MDKVQLRPVRFREANLTGLMTHRVLPTPSPTWWPRPIIAERQFGNDTVTRRRWPTPTHPAALTDPGHPPAPLARFGRPLHPMFPEFQSAAPSPCRAAA